MIPNETNETSCATDDNITNVLGRNMTLIRTTSGKHSPQSWHQRWIQHHHDKKDVVYLRIVYLRFHRRCEAVDSHMFNEIHVNQSQMSGMR